MQHQIGTREEWLAARKALLLKEKAHTRAGDALAAERRALPWVRVDKSYVFEGPNGKVSLADLFQGRSQLFVYHFMFGPGAEQGCPGCSFLSDHVDGARQHFEQKDLSFVAVARAPWAELDRFRRRMGWNFDFVSSGDTSFNYDFGVSFRREDLEAGPVTYNFAEIKDAIEDLPGFSTFYKNQTGEIFHTYSSYGRGGDAFIGAYTFLDVAPLGRNEKVEHGQTMDWVRHHDRYETRSSHACCSAA